MKPLRPKIKGARSRKRPATRFRWSRERSETRTPLRYLVVRHTRLGVVGLLERGRAWGYHGPDPLRAWQGTKPLPPPVHPQPFVATSLSASGWEENTMAGIDVDKSGKISCKRLVGLANSLPQNVT